MVEEQNEVVEETTEDQVDESKFESAGDDSVIKVDLSKPPVSETETEDITNEEASTDEVHREESKEPEALTLEEITDTEEEVSETIEAIEDIVEQSKVNGNPLPENIQKLVDFMEDTGGSVEDYVSLNRDVASMDNSEILDEYYKKTKSHLSSEERDFLLEDKYGFDEDVDDDRTIRSKKIALKEQVAEARAYLDGQKSKYYEEIKAGSKLTSEQQEAISFFNRYNKESEETDNLINTNKDIFNKKTNNLFNDKFKGFEYEIGDKKFRFNVKNVEDVKNNQSRTIKWQMLKVITSLCLRP